jgi:hypothetical protein
MWVLFVLAAFWLAYTTMHATKVAKVAYHTKHIELNNVAADTLSRNLNKPYHEVNESDKTYIVKKIEQIQSGQIDTRNDLAAEFVIPYMPKLDR